jgi:hypothetical protein
LFVSGSLLSATTVVSGCLQHNRFRTISIQKFTVCEANGNFTVAGTISIAARWGGDEEWRTFHNVSVVVFTEQGDRICSAELGSLSRGEDETISLSCPRFPHRVEIQTEESPCSGRTTIHYYVYTGRADDGTRLWEKRERECN